MHHVTQCLYAYHTALSARIECAIATGDQDQVERVLRECAVELERAAAELTERAQRIRTMEQSHRVEATLGEPPPWAVAPRAR